MPGTLGGAGTTERAPARQLSEPVSPPPRSTLGSESLTIVTGPAGSGKTETLSSWYAAAKRSAELVAVWIDCHSRAADGRVLDELLATPSTVDSPPDSLFFIDGAEHITAADALAVRRRLDAGSRFVIASRRDHGSLIGEPEARMIGPAELRLSDEYVRQRIKEASPHLSEPATGTLVKRLDGWGAGLGIVANVLPHECDPERFAQGFDGRDRDVVDYFETEVFGGLEKEDRDFLTRTSVLTQPDGSASDALLQTRWSHERFARLAAANVLVTASEDGKFRWMPLARDFLLMHLERIGVDFRRSLHERLLGFYRSENLYTEAIEQAAELDGDAWVTEIASEAGLSIVSTARPRDVIDWLDKVPTEAIKRHPEVALVAATALWFADGDRSAPTVNDWLTFAEHADTTTTIADAVSHQSAIDAARSAFGAIGLEERIRLAERAFAVEGPHSTSWAALAASAAGVAFYFADDTKSARTWLTECLRIAKTLGSTNQLWASNTVSGAALATMALIEADHADHERGEAFVAAAYLSRHAHGAEPIGGGLGPLARVLHDHHRAGDRAAPQIELLREIATEAKITQVGVLAHIELVRAEVTTGNTNGALDELNTLGQRISNLGDAGKLITRRHAAVERLLELPRQVPDGFDHNALTDREEEVLRLLDSDLTRREIGEELFLAHNTVKTYVQRLYQKLGVSSRPAAVAAARERGWIP